MKTLSYKDYLAKIEFSVEDMLIIGQVIGLSDSLYFHAQSADQIEDMFHQCVDNYLTFCTEVGKEPEKSYKGSFNVRLTEDLHRRADFEAARRGISLNQLVAQSLEHELGDRPKETVYIMTQPVVEAMMNTGASSAVNFQPVMTPKTEKGVTKQWQAALN